MRFFFLLMCLIWGLTWMAIKTGVASVPPFLFASLRLLAAGAVLMGLARARGQSVSLRGRMGRVVAAAVLVNTVAYGALFWGMQWVPSGISAVVNLSLIPLGLFSMGLLVKEETFSYQKLGAIVVGVIGLFILFAPRIRGDERPELVGMIVIVTGTLAYCWGSILSRPLLRELETLALGGLESCIGGLGLALLAVFFEPIGLPTFRAFLSPPVLLSWLFLVLGGSVSAFTIYLTLLRDWGPSRAGLYAFVSPVVALLVGVLFFEESLGPFEIIGSVTMLGAAGIALERA
ncbi:MAG TPA: EamA family transporter [Vicinamibacteria bacterium]|nr:EamA family transporter [Vicinamibacteria bacterium]